VSAPRVNVNSLVALADSLSPVVSLYPESNLSKERLADPFIASAYQVSVSSRLPLKKPVPRRARSLLPNRSALARTRLLAPSSDPLRMIKLSPNTSLPQPSSRVSSLAKADVSYSFHSILSLPSFSLTFFSSPQTSASMSPKLWIHAEVALQLAKDKTAPRSVERCRWVASLRNASSTLAKQDGNPLSLATSVFEFDPTLHLTTRPPSDISLPDTTSATVHYRRSPFRLSHVFPLSHI